MKSDPTFEIFLVALPGLEAPLADEARDAGFANAQATAGGVAFEGGWGDVWRANMVLRGATRVLARIGGFRALHLAQLDKRARKFPWADFLRADVPVRVETTCRKSRIYHAGAATQRIETALRESLGAQITPDATVRLMVRIEDDWCGFSLDTSGASLHKRGHKLAVGKAPLRETMAAMFLRQCGYTGTEPVLDPMCGSGTFVIEAAEIAAGVIAGRGRSFAFEELAGFDPDAVAALREGPEAPPVPHVFRGFDRDAGAVRNSTTNAQAAGVEGITAFAQQAVGDLQRPEGPPGLVMVNPPYGARIGNKKLLYALYGTLGKTLRERFAGWRVGIVTSDGSLARATDLPFLPLGPAVAHGGLKVRLYRTDPLR